MSRSLAFHVPPDARPVGVHALLGAFEDEPEGFGTRSELLERMKVRMVADSKPRGEAIQLAEDLGIVANRQGRIVETEYGAVLRSIVNANDLLHGMQYVSWSSDNPEHVSRLWTYRAIVDALWKEAPVVLDAACKRRLVEDILVEASQTFEGVPGYDLARTSVGPKTIDGVTCWLRDLSPPAIVGERVSHRQSCAPQLVVLALSAVGRLSGASAGTDFRLTPEHREFLCRCCFLSRESLDRMLEWSVATQPQLLRWGTLISTYGRQIVLMKLDLQPGDIR